MTQLRHIFIGYLCSKEVVREFSWPLKNISISLVERSRCLRLNDSTVAVLWERTKNRRRMIQFSTEMQCSLIEVDAIMSRVSIFALCNIF